MVVRFARRQAAKDEVDVDTRWSVVPGSLCKHKSSRLKINSETVSCNIPSGIARSGSRIEAGTAAEGEKYTDLARLARSFRRVRGAARRRGGEAKGA